MTTPQPQGLPPQTFAEWLAQPVDWDVMGNPITRSMTLHGAYMSAAEYGWNAATEALRAHLEQSSQHPTPSPAQAAMQVGCENIDGTLNIHPETATCSVCEPAQAVDAVDEREAFEKTPLMAGSLFKRRCDDPDKYWDGNVQDDWELWQACAALQSSRQPQVHAGVTAWIGDRTVSQIVTEIELRHERKQGKRSQAGEAIANAARRCLEELAAIATKEPK